MKKTRKFISIFAILFAIVLALSVCFFAACGNKEEDETPTPEVQDDESKDDDTKDDDTTVTPNPDPEPDPDPDPTPADTKVIDVATPDEAENTTAGDAVFANNKDVTIEVGEDGTYVVSGTASIMTAADAAWWYADETAEGGDPYVVIKIAAAEGETITLNTGKTYTNTGDGNADFVDGYLYTVYLLAFDETTGSCTSEATYTITVAGETTGTTYAVSFAGMELPEGEGNDGGVVLTEVATIDFTDTTKYSTSSDDGKTKCIDDTAVSSSTTGATEYTTTSNGVESTHYSLAVNVYDNEGKETGFKCMQSDEKQTKLDTQNKVQCVNFGGAADTNKSSLVYYLDAGTYTVTLKYFGPKSTINEGTGEVTEDKSGRYGTVLDSTGSELVSTVATEEKTGTGQDIMTRTITIELTSAQNIYIGSKTSGLYLTFVGIYA